MFRRILFVSTCLTVSLFTAPTTITVGVSTDVDMGTVVGGLDGGTPETTDLRGALNHVNSFPNANGYIVNFTPNISSITLGAMLPILNLVQNYPLTVDGGTGVIIDGASTYRGFFAHQGPITLKNLQLQNLNAAGGEGGFPGGGGGLGAGAGLFVNNAQVILSNVTMNSSIASGGNGGTNSMVITGGAGGGGGLGGKGADGTDASARGGGGGLGGAGGIIVFPNGDGSGGGGVNCGANHTGEGGGTVSLLDGAQGGAIGSNGGGGGGSSGGDGGPLGGGGGAGSSGSGGGGGGINGGDGMSGQGGTGGYFGGGGGGGGDGGFGGGGGGRNGVPIRAGNGGFGGGGGSGQGGVGSDGGNGGFGGGGGGCGTSPNPGVGGVGGGDGNAIDYAGQGGGGAGFGGGIFVNDSGTLIIQNAFSTEGNSSSAGTGFNPGWAAGNDCFVVTGGPVILDPNGSSITMSQSIADDSAASFVGAMPGTRTGSASGATIIIGQTASAAGTVFFPSTNQSTYSGPTLIQKGTLSLDGSIVSPVTVMNGGKLKGTGTVNQSVTIEGGGHLQAGNSIGTITLGSLVLANAQSVLELDIDISAGSTLSSFYTVNGPVALNHGTLQLNYSPQNGSQNTYAYDFLGFVGGDPGVFGTILSVPGYLATVTKTSNLLTLHLALYSTFLGAGVSLTPNQQAILSYLLALQTVPSLQPVLTNLAELTPDQLRAALDSISPARNEAAPYFANQTAFAMGLIPLSRLRDKRILDHMAVAKNKNSLSAAFMEKRTSLVAQNSDDLTYLSQNKPAGKAKTAAAKPEKYGFWAAGFGDFLSQDGMNSNPKIRDTASGAVVGFDYYGYQNGIFTLSTGYLHNDITEHEGSGTSNGAMLDLVGTGYIGDGYIEAGAFGGYNRFHMKRHISVPGFNPISVTASSDFNLWVFMPHLGGGYDWVMDWGIVEPFASMDWAISFQETYREKGGAPLNAKIESSTPSILRSQIGCNAYETWDMANGIVILQESVSYINKALFDTKMRSAIIIPTAVPSGAPGSFSLQTYDRTLNLFGAGLEVFYKHKPSGFFVSGTYLGEFGSGFISNEVVGTLGVFF